MNIKKLLNLFNHSHNKINYFIFLQFSLMAEFQLSTSIIIGSFRCQFIFIKSSYLLFASHFHTVRYNTNFNKQLCGYGMYDFHIFLKSKQLIITIETYKLLPTHVSVSLLLHRILIRFFLAFAKISNFWPLNDISFLYWSLDIQVYMP